MILPIEWKQSRSFLAICPGCSVDNCNSVAAATYWNDSEFSYFSVFCLVIKTLLWRIWVSGGTEQGAP